MIQLELTKALQREKDTGVPMQLIIESEPLTDVDSDDDTYHPPATTPKTTAPPTIQPGPPTDSDSDDDTFHPPPTTQPISREREPSTTK